MFNVSDYTAPARDRTTKAIGGYIKAKGSLMVAMTQAFVAFAASDPSISLKACSQALKDTHPGLSEGSANVYRSHIRTAMAEPGVRAALQAKVGNPSLLTVEQFDALVVEFAATLKPRAKEKEAETIKQEAARGASANPAPTEVLGGAVQPTAETFASAAIAALDLIAQLAIGSDDGEAQFAFIEARVSEIRAEITKARASREIAAAFKASNIEAAAEVEAERLAAA